MVLSLAIVQINKMKKNHKIPDHVAVIMDGNGRWAKKLGRKRVFGHENGTNSVRECIEGCR